jgi:NAD(P) transhydrogenase subunit alpha
MVTAYDVRAAAGEEVRSLGATFLDLELDSQEGEGGYARVQSPEFLAQQRVLLGAQVAKADVVVTTAAVPGRPAPLLVTAEMVAGMRAGSVIVDLGADVEAAEGGGNCELTRGGETIEINGVTIVGPRNAASSYPLHASALYARNVANLMGLLLRDGVIDPDWDDEIVAGCVVTRDGEVISR